MFDKFLEETSTFRDVYFLCSGGYDSTYMLLKLYKKIKNKKYILFNDTGLNIQQCKDTVYKLARITNLKLLVAKPEKGAISSVAESFRRLPKALELKRKNKYHKRVFPCCRKLKENPTKKFYNEKDLFLFGIRPGDSRNRGFFLYKLKKEGTFIHYNKEKRAWFGYPLRDVRKKEVEDFIHSLPFKVEHSCCRICPVALLFNITNNKIQYANSRQFYYKLTGKRWCNDLTGVIECQKL